MATRLNSAVLDHSGSKVDGLEKGEEAGGGGVCRGLGILTPLGMSWARSSKQLLPTVRQAQGWGWAGLGVLLAALLKEGHYGVLVVWSAVPGFRPLLFLFPRKRQSHPSEHGDSSYPTLLLQKRPGWVVAALGRDPGLSIPCPGVYSNTGASFLLG